MDIEQLKEEVHKFRGECLAKTEVCDGLRKAHLEQVAKIEQANSEIEKRAEELNSISEEICKTRQLCEHLQSSLPTKDLLEQVRSASESLRAEYGEKISKLEEANSRLVVALDDASARIQDLERKVCARDEEIAKSESNKYKDRESYTLKLEDENRIVKEQLTWKNEQFSHLKDAHKKLHTHFQTSKVEWQKERDALVDEISSLQATLDTQVRVSQSLETQFRTCNQALAHQESRRKFLEIELSESRSRLENVFSESQGAKLETEQLIMKRDEEIADLWSLLRKKDILLNEMKYKIAQLEQEKSYLSISKEDFEQAQLNNSVTSCSSKKLRDKLHNLEKLHDKCAADMKETEAEWNVHIEKLKEDLRYCTSELDDKNRCIRETYKELENSQYLLEVKNEEIFAIIMVLKSEFHIAYSEVFDAKEKLEMKTKQFEDRNVLLEQQLDIQNTELLKVTDELRRHKVLLDGSNACQSYLKEDGVSTFDALEIAELLAKKTPEVEKYELELLKWKADMDNLKLRLEESQQVHEQENAKLLLVLKEQHDKHTKLHEQVCELEALAVQKSEAAKTLKEENYSYARIAQEMEHSTTRLFDELSQLKIEISNKETEILDLSEAHKGLELEIEERDLKVLELETLDQNLTSVKIYFSENESLFNQSLKRATDHNVLLSEEMSRITANPKSRYEKEKISSERMVEELKSQEQVLLTELKKASTDRDNLLSQFGSISDRIEMFTRDGVELMNMLEKMSGSSEEFSEPESDNVGE